MINTDSDAAYLGEAALVPYHSPISESGILFYDTLFDENASCHLAFGAAYPKCVKGASGKTPRELRDLGVNKSQVHADFMIGTPDLDITGVTWEGGRVPVFKNGDFAF
jgi:aminopeptidase